jgi:hypothetical protein
MQTSPSKDLRIFAVVTLAFMFAIFAIKIALNRPRVTSSSDLKRFAELGYGADFEIVESIVLKPTIMANQGTSLFAVRTTAATADAHFTDAAWTRSERPPFSGPNRTNLIRTGVEMDQHATILYLQKKRPREFFGDVGPEVGQA